MWVGHVTEASSRPRICLEGNNDQLRSNNQSRDNNQSKNNNYKTEGRLIYQWPREEKRLIADRRLVAERG